VLEPVRRQRIGWKVSAIAEIAQLKFIGVFFSCWPARRRHRRRFLFSFYFLSACLRIHYSGFALRISTDKQLRSRLITFLLKLSSWTMMWKCKRGTVAARFSPVSPLPTPAGFCLARKISGAFVIRENFTPFCLWSGEYHKKTVINFPKFYLHLFGLIFFTVTSVAIFYLDIFDCFNPRRQEKKRNFSRFSLE
jgi:hypothetical protein